MRDDDGRIGRLVFFVDLLGGRLRMKKKQKGEKHKIRRAALRGY
jgi:hypothetical protein